MRLLVTGAPGTRLTPLRELLALLVAPEQLLPPARVAAVDGHLLAGLGWSVDAPPATPLATHRPDPMTLDGARALLTDIGAPQDAPPDAGSATGLLVPWWRRLLGDDVAIIVGIEDPEVVSWRAALSADIEPEQALAAWLAWHRHLAAGAAGMPVIVADPTAVATPAGRDALAAVLSVVGLLEAMPGEPSTSNVPDGQHSDGAAGSAPAPDPARTALAGPARDLAAAWRPGPVTLQAPFTLEVAAPEPWEVALLATGRRLTAAARLRARDRQAVEDAEARALAAESLEAELALSTVRLDDLDARLSAAVEDAQVTAERLRAASADAADLRARADELVSLESTRRSELGAAIAREQALALAHLRRGASPVGRFAGRWTQLADRVGLVRVADRVADASIAAALLRPRILRPHPLFDAAWYVDQYDDVRETGADPYRHYRRHGSREGRRPNAYLDPDWYRARYPDVTASGLDPMDHYHEHGWREGRDPGPDFDTGWYLRAYPDVLVSGIDPLAHFLSHGQAESRSPRSHDGARWSLGIGPLDGVSGRPSLPAVARAAAGSDARDAAATVAQRPTDRWAADMATALLALPAGAVALVAAERGEVPPRAEGRITRWLAPVAGGHSTGGGRLPPSDRSALVHLEVNRWTGADHLLVHRDQAWWLERCPELVAHLDRYRRVPMGAVRVSAWRLTPVSQPPDDGTAGLIARIRPTMGRELVTLAWGVSASQLAPRLGGTVFEPPVDGETLPYLDGTVDIVVIPGEAAGRLPEARRVATRAVLRVVGRRHDLEPAWLAPSLAVPPRTTVALVGGRDGFADDGTIARVADALLDAPVEELLVAAAAGASPRLPSGPGLPRARVLPVDRASSLAERAVAAAAATSAEYVALLDGDALPLPGWLGPLAGALETGAIDGAVPLLVTEDGLLAGTDGRDAGDARARVIRAIDSAPICPVVVRRSDLLALDAQDAAEPGGLVLADDGATLRFRRAGRLDPAAIAVLAGTPGAAS